MEALRGQYKAARRAPRANANRLMRQEKKALKRLERALAQELCHLDRSQFELSCVQDQVQHTEDNHFLRSFYFEEANGRSMYDFCRRYATDRTLRSEVEVYTETIYHHPTHDLIQYWHLLPGSSTPEHLFPRCKGAFDFKDAARDREYDWPNATYVSPTLFLEAVGEQERGQFDGYDLTESE